MQLSRTFAIVRRGEVREWLKRSASKAGGKLQR
jgi:hypothetical protein